MITGFDEGEAALIQLLQLIALDLDALMEEHQLPESTEAGVAQILHEVNCVQEVIRTHHPNFIGDGEADDDEGDSGGEDEEEDPPTRRLHCGNP